MLIINLVKQFLYRGKNIVKKWWKNISTKIWSWLKKKEEQFQSISICQICEKLSESEKLRDHCHITRKFRGSAHCSCNINLQLTKKVPVEFHKLRFCDSHLIFYEFNKFDVKIGVIPNRLEKYMVFILNKNLVFMESIQFMNSSLEKKLVRW